MSTKKYINKCWILYPSRWVIRLYIVHALLNTYIFTDSDMAQKYFYYYCLIVRLLFSLVQWGASGRRGRSFPAPSLEVGVPPIWTSSRHMLLWQLLAALGPWVSPGDSSPGRTLLSSPLHCFPDRRLHCCHWVRYIIRCNYCFYIDANFGAHPPTSLPLRLLSKLIKFRTKTTFGQYCLLICLLLILQRTRCLRKSLGPEDWKVYHVYGRSPQKRLWNRLFSRRVITLFISQNTCFLKLDYSSCQKYDFVIINLSLGIT